MLELWKADENIINIINHLRKKKRKRPTMKNIFKEVNNNMEEQDKLTLPVFNDIMDNLQSLNVIFDGGKDDKESFMVNRETLFSDDIQNDSFIDVDENMFKYIDDKFYEVILNKIKIQVKNEVKNEINRLSNLDTTLLNTHEISNTGNIINKEITDLFKAEIEFLKNELASKNKIIEVLLKDKSSDNCNNNDEQNFDNTKDNDFDAPKNPIKLIKEQNNRSNTIALTNRFDILSTMPISSSGLEDNNDETITNIPHNSSIESIKADSINHDKKYRSTTIMGRSLIKDIKAYKMRDSITKGDRIYVKSFSGATISDMEDYVKPSLKYNPDLVILQIGTND